MIRKHVLQFLSFSKYVECKVPCICRSSRSEVFCKKGVLRNFAKFTEKHLCQSLFFNKVADWGLALLKKITLAQVFSCEFCQISKNTFSYKTPPPVTASGFDRAQCYCDYGGISLANLNKQIVANSSDW